MSLVGEEVMVTVTMIPSPKSKSETKLTERAHPAASVRAAAVCAVAFFSLPLLTWMTADSGGSFVHRDMRTVSTAVPATEVKEPSGGSAENSHRPTVEPSAKESGPTDPDEQIRPNGFAPKELLMKLTIDQHGFATDKQVEAQLKILSMCESSGWDQRDGWNAWVQMDHVTTLKTLGLDVAQLKVHSGAGSGRCCWGSWQISPSYLLKLTRYDFPADQTLIAFPRVVAPIRSLRLDSASVSDASLRAIGELTTLQEIDARATQVTDDGLAILAELTRLKALDLECTQVSDAGLVHVKRLTKLERLDLDSTVVTDAGLAHLKGLTKLQVLDLDRTRVTDSGLPHLSGLTRLETLWLVNTHVTDAGLAHLESLTSLTRLYLIGTQVTDTGAAELNRALPGLRIFR